MTRANHILILGLLTGAAFAQTPPPKPGSVAGTVTSALTGQPIPKATVKLHGRGVAYLAVSDAAGRFRINAVPPARNYFIEATCPGFDQLAMARPTIQVAEEQAVTDVSVKLSPLAVIAGKVVDADGEPMPRVSVQALRSYYQNGVKRMGTWRYATTDDHGEYRLYDLQTGRYFVLASPQIPPEPAPNVRVHADQPAELDRATFFPSSADTSGATGIAVTPGDEISGTNIRVPRLAAHHIRGKAVDAQSGQAVHGAQVQAQPCTFGLANNNFNGTRTVALKPDGTFDLGGVFPGLYCLTIREGQTGHASFAQQNVNVAARDVDDVILSVVAGISIKGTLSFETPLDDKQKSPPPYLTFTDPFGNDLSVSIRDPANFVLNDVFPLSYQLQQMQLPFGWYLKMIQYGDRDISDGHLTVTSSDAPLTLVAASDSALVAVNVEMPDGVPPAGAMAVLAPAGRYAQRQDLIRYSYSGAGAVVMIGGVAPGEYKLYVFPERDQGIGQSLELLQLLDAYAVAVTIQPKDNQTVQARLIPADVVNDANSRIQ